MIAIFGPVRLPTQNRWRDWGIRWTLSILSFADGAARAILVELDAKLIGDN